MITEKEKLKILETKKSTLSCLAVPGQSAGKHTEFFFFPPCFFLLISHS